MGHKLRIDSESINYPATIIKIDNLHDIEGADRLKRTVVFGNDVIVSVDTKIGDGFIYFQAGTQLAEEYCSYNNLYTDSEMNRDKDQKGYVSPKKRLIKSLKLRGVISNGILMPLDSIFAWDGDLGQFNEGDSFTHIGDIEVCRKYTPPVARNSGTGQPKTVKRQRLTDLIPQGQFAFHHETEHLARNLGKIDITKPVVLTRKFHGSSNINSHVLVFRQLTWIEKIAKFFGVLVNDKEYGYIWSSGKPRARMPKGLDSATNAWDTPNQSYYKENIWEKKAKEISDKIEKGITIYSELIGEGIQGADYTYGRELDMVVYRITSTNPDGIVTEFTWDQVNTYCDKYGFEYVTEYFAGMIPVENKEEYLDLLISQYLDKKYDDCKVDEGICLRQGNYIVKLKSPKFIMGESKQLAKEQESLPDVNDEVSA